MTFLRKAVAIKILIKTIFDLLSFHKFFPYTQRRNSFNKITLDCCLLNDLCNRALELSTPETVQLTPRWKCHSGCQTQHVDRTAFQK